jgi:hypothetical protein
MNPGPGGPKIRIRLRNTGILTNVLVDFSRERGRRGSAHHQASIFGQTFQPHSRLGESGAQSEDFYLLETRAVTRYGCRLDDESGFNPRFLWREIIKLLPHVFYRAKTFMKDAKPSALRREHTVQLFKTFFGLCGSGSADSPSRHCSCEVDRGGVGEKTDTGTLEIFFNSS